MINKLGENMRLKLLTLIATATLAACGGGGGGLTVANGVTTMSGTVIDGYIENAKVCLDLNGNLLCDANEPSSTTDKDGKYSISYDGDIAGKHIIAVVTAESKDADDNGKTIAEAGKEAFNLAAPAAKPEAVTPLTTLVTHAMLADTTIKSDDAGFKKAEEIVKANTGIQVALLSNNFVAKPDTAAQDLAKVISVALGDVSKELKANLDEKKKTDATLTTTSDTANGQKTIEQNIVKAVSSQIATAVASDGKLTKTVTETITENKSSTSNVVSGQINNIIVATKTGASTAVSDAKSIFAKGLIIAGPDNGTLKDGQTRYKDNLEVQFLKGDVATRTFLNNKKILYINPNNTASWEDRYDWGRQYVLSKTGEWVYDPDISTGIVTANGDITFDQNCMTFKVDVNKVDADEVVCFTQKDISGKKIKDLIDGFCKDVDLKAFPNCNKEAVFAEGSLAYDITLGVTNDRYRNEVNYTWDGYATTDNKKTIDAFIDYSIKNESWMGSDCNTGFKVKSYDAAAKKGVMFWSDASKFGCNNAYKQQFKSVEETSFEVKTVGNVEMLVLDIASVFKKNNFGDGIGQKFIFNYMYDETLKKGGIYKGELTLKNTKRQMEFNGDTKLGTKEVLESYLKAIGMTDYPFPTVPAIVSK
jgi:hypothetical protein